MIAGLTPDEDPSQGTQQACNEMELKILLNQVVHR